MPVARFQMPDGRIARFEVPEGTTPEQAQEMIKKSLESGPPQRSDISAQQAADRELYSPAKGMSGLEAFGVSMGKGLTDIGRGLGLAEPASEAEITGMEQLSQERPFASGAGEIIGQALPFVPAAIGASMAAPAVGLGATGTQALNIAGQGLVGAAEGGTIARGTGQDVMGSALTGGAVAAGVEAVSPVLGRAITTTYRRMTGGDPKDAISVAKKFQQIMDNKKITREISEAVPSIENLKDTSRAVYKEIDNMGVSLKPDAYQKLVTRLSADARKMGLDKDITPKSMQALSRFEEKIGDATSLTELDTLRKIANNAAGSLDKPDAAIAKSMVNTIDDYLDNLHPGSFDAKNVDPKEVAKQYRVARDLWGRASRSEMIQEAMDKARLQASGFENGIRIQFRQILSNKKLSKRFTAGEREAMRKVVKGGSGENLARLIGRFAPSEGSAHNVLTSMAGVAGGAAAGGPIGAVIVPGVGFVSRKMAQNMTAKNAEFADQVIRAGRDARKITAAYMKNTPADKRNPEDLAELLMRKDIDFSTLPKNDFTEKAKVISIKRAAAAAGATAASAQPETNQEEQ